MGSIFLLADDYFSLFYCCEFLMLSKAELFLAKTGRERSLESSLGSGEGSSISLKVDLIGPRGGSFSTLTSASICGCLD